MIRKFTRQAGGDDSVLTIDHYYDRGGILRNVVAIGGAINKTHIVQRVDFDESGARIRDDKNIIAGPGYPFPEISDENGLLSRNPREAYDHVCGGK